MRIIQSFWTGGKDLTKDKFGWAEPKYNSISWALSVCLLRKFYDKVELYTDENGYQLFIQRMQLPYTKVHIVLDSLNRYNKQLWALAKLKTYSLQEEPFLHVDGDVFIWEPFSEKLLSSQFIAQNLEYGTEFFEKIFNEIDKNLTYIPPFVLEEKSKTPKIKYYNAGILGGHDFVFFKRFAEESLVFINENEKTLNKISVSNFNIYIEQYFFYCMLMKESKSVSCLFPFVMNDLLYEGFGEFESVPYKKKYLHLMGNYKKSIYTCKLMERRMRQDFPEKYYAILDTHSQANGAPSKNVNEWHNRIIKDYNSKKIPCREQPTFLIEPIKYFAKTLTIISQMGNDLSRLTDQELVFEFVQRIDSSIVKDVYEYESSIVDFLLLPHDWSENNLLAKNLLSNQYYEILDKLDSESTIQIRKENALIRSKWNWVSGEMKSAELVVTLNRNLSENTYSTLLLQGERCNEYFECEIDQLDSVILDLIAQPISLRNMIKELSSYFDGDELNQNLDEFRQLISGRLKRLNYYGCFDLK
jgi:hypothetical protein